MHRRQPAEPCANLALIVARRDAQQGVIVALGAHLGIARAKGIEQVCRHDTNVDAAVVARMLWRIPRWVSFARVDSEAIVGILDEECCALASEQGVALCRAEHTCGIIAQPQRLRTDSIAVMVNSCCGKNTG